MVVVSEVHLIKSYVFKEGDSGACKPGSEAVNKNRRLSSLAVGCMNKNSKLFELN